MLCDIQRRKIVTPPPAAPVVTVAAVQPVLSPSDSGEEQVLSSNSSRGATTNNINNNTNLYRDRDIATTTTTASGGTNAELAGENERLRRENVQLNKELNLMKSLCSNIYVMMSNYATEKPSEGSTSQPSTETATMQPLDLLPLKRLAEECSRNAGAGNCGDDGTERDGISPRLFGVTIGVKRVREDGSSETQEQYNDLQLQQPGGGDVKSEPLDHGSSSVDNNESTWLMMKQSQPSD